MKDACHVSLSINHVQCICRLGMVAGYSITAVLHWAGSIRVVNYHRSHGLQTFCLYTRFINAFTLVYFGYLPLIDYIEYAFVEKKIFIYIYIKCMSVQEDCACLHMRTGCLGRDWLVLIHHLSVILWLFRSKARVFMNVSNVHYSVNREILRMFLKVM